MWLKINWVAKSILSLVKDVYKSHRLCDVIYERSVYYFYFSFQYSTTAMNKGLPYVTCLQCAGKFPLSEVALTTNRHVFETWRHTINASTASKNPDSSVTPEF